MFFLGITQTGLTVNFPHMLDEQTRHIAHVIQSSQSKGVTVEATAEAEKEWCETMRRLAVLNEDFLSSCTPGYYNQEGNPSAENSLLMAQYGAGSDAFFALLEQWRTEGNLEGLIVQ
jgi:cyclohexanone monooxygenase